MNPFTLKKQPSDIMREIALKAKKLRKQAGWTQTECAQRAGLSLASLKRFEQSGQVSLESLLKLANLLGRLEDFSPIFEIKQSPKELDRLFSDNDK